MKFEKIPKSKFILKIELDDYEAEGIKQDLVDGFKRLYLTESSKTFLTNLEKLLK